MTANANNPAVELAYESMAGTKIYCLKDITQISAFRGVAAEKAKRFASLCITEKEMTDLLETAIDGVNKNQDLVKAMAILSELRFRVKMICEENSLLELAYIYLLLEGEDIDRPSQEMNAKKAQLVTGEIDLKGFFLRKALQLADNFSQKPGEDLLNYLEAVKSLMLPLERFSQ